MDDATQVNESSPAANQREGEGTTGREGAGRRQRQRPREGPRGDGGHTRHHQPGRGGATNRDVGPRTRSRTAKRVDRQQGAAKCTAREHQGRERRERAGGAARATTTAARDEKGGPAPGRRRGEGRPGRGAGGGQGGAQAPRETRNRRGQPARPVRR